MKKSFGSVSLLMAVLAFNSVAQADIISCSFTEPFMSTDYSMAQQSLTITDHVTANGKPKKTVVKNVSFQIKGPGEFELVAKNGQVIQKLKLNNQGSDGMSDTVFPYDVEWIRVKGQQGLFGGCESNYLKANRENQ